MSRRLVIVATAALALLASGCVMPDQLSQIQKDVADVRQQLRAVQDAQTRTDERLAELQGSGRDDDESVSREEFAELQVEADRASQNAAMATAQLNDLNARIDRLTQEIQQTRDLARSSAMRSETRLDVDDLSSPGAVGSAPGSASSAAPRGPAQGGDAEDAVPDAEQLYNTAYADYSKGNYALAVSGFEEYVERFPTSPLADNALYWIGECLFSQGAYSDAVSAFDRLLDFDEQSDKAAAANLKKALSYLEMNQIGQAIIQLRYVRTEYPGSDEAKIARDKLSALGAQP